MTSIAAAAVPTIARPREDGRDDPRRDGAASPSGRNAYARTGRTMF
jgi:hypothetical protein